MNIHIWTFEEIEALEDFNYNKEDFIPWEDFKKVLNEKKEEVQSEDLFEKSENEESHWFYGLVSYKNEIILGEIMPGIGFCEVDLEDLLKEEEYLEDVTKEENVLFCLLDILLENPERYNKKKETFIDKETLKKIRMLKLNNLVQNIKGEPLNGQGRSC